MGSKRIGASRRVVVGLFLFLTGASALANGIMTPEYARGEYRPKSMVLIPPQATVSKNKVASTEQMIEEGSKLEDAAVLVLSRQFAELGYELNTLSVAEVIADPELQTMVRNVNERYDEELARMGFKAKEIRSRRYGLGDPARILAARLGAEALAIGRIDASGATGGQKTMAFLIGGSMGHASMSVGIVAGDNGDIEAFISAIDPGMSPEKLAQDPVGVMANLADKALKKFPAPGEAAKYKKKWPQSSNREVPASIEPDDQAMDDLEALFGDETTVEEAPNEEAMEEAVDVEVDVEEGDVEAAIEAEIESAAEEAAESGD
jgi:hypothetical protein